MFEGFSIWGLGNALFQKLLCVESSILTRSRHETGAHVRCSLQGLSSLAWLITSITIITSTIITILTMIITVIPILTTILQAFAGSLIRRVLLLAHCSGGHFRLLNPMML